MNDIFLYPVPAFADPNDIKLLIVTSAQGGVTETPPDPGGTIVAGWFSRGKWHDLKALVAAERDVRERARLAKRRKEHEALQRAAALAREVIELVHEAELEQLNQFARMQTLLEGAARADSLAARVRQANEASALALALIRELEEEEEAIAFFLLN
jgi:hypothetical protein